MEQPEDKKGRFFTPGTIIVFIMLFACIYYYLYIIISTLTGTHMGGNQSMEAEAFVIGGTEILTVIAAVVTLATVIASTIIAYKKDNERLSHTKETLSKEHTTLQQLIQGDIAETRNDINEVRSDIGRTDATVTKIWEKALQQQQAASKLPDSASFLNSAQAMWNENARLHMEIERLSTANRNQELELQRMEAENQKLKMRIARYREKEQGRDR